jgi:hypothetical protein
MKKNLVVLTGIALFIAVLVAFGCNRDSKPKPVEEAGGVPTAATVDTTKVDIYLKAVVINGRTHLEMHEEKKPECPVIDGLLTVVYGGYTVTWKKAPDSNIDEVTDIRPINDVGGIFVGLREVKSESLWTLEIPENPDTGIIKYEIDFIVKDDKDSIHTIDPYLKIPPELN